MKTRASPLRVLEGPVLGALLGASALHWCRHAVAEESDAGRLFREGRALVVEGRFADACPKLEESQRLEPRLGTKLNVAFCRERLGAIATAWLAFREAAIAARREGDVARETFARGRANALGPRVPWLRVRAAEDVDADALTVLLDGAVVAPSTWGKELPVNPGEHVLVAALVGEEYWRTGLVIEESGHMDVAIPPAPPARPAATATGTAHPSAPSATSPGAAPDAGASVAGHFVYELGAFLGLMAVDTRRATPASRPDEVRLSSVQDGMTQTISCAEWLCEYDSLSTAGVVPGMMGFVGYATTPHLSLGLRFLLGPRIDGGALVALGPSASFVLLERFRAGPAVFFGSASHAATGSVYVQGPTSSGSVYTRLEASLGWSMGLGAELGYTLTSSPSGSIILQATPLFLYGSNGMSWSVPIGASYRWN